LKKVELTMDKQEQYKIIKALAEGRIKKYELWLSLESHADT